MQVQDALYWLSRSHARVQIVSTFKQPATAKQLSRVVRLTNDACSDALLDMAAHGLVSCLNSRATKSRIYWLTRFGARCQRELRIAFNLPSLSHDLPCVDWDLYGWVCFSHRSAIIRILKEPLQPATIKRRARSAFPGLRMSANNVRDVIRLFKARGIVAAVRVRKKKHLRYELTPVGRELQQLLLKAEALR